ncbi:hypothetical protein MHB81_14905 [Paenibacillus sp. FSL H7-0326]
MNSFISLLDKNSNLRQEVPNINFTPKRDQVPTSLYGITGWLEEKTPDKGRFSAEKKPAA